MLLFLLKRKKERKKTQRAFFTHLMCAFFTCACLCMFFLGAWIVVRVRWLAARTPSPRAT